MANIKGGNGKDLLNGTASADTISGNNGDDTINGLGGNDTIDGGNGDDIMNGGTGDDNIKGGLGKDIFLHNVSENIDSVTTTRDVYDGGDGMDTLRLFVTQAQANDLAGAIAAFNASNKNNLFNFQNYVSYVDLRVIRIENIELVIEGGNQAPNAVNDTASVSEDGPSVLINVLANDTDPDVGDTKTLVSTTAPGHGTAVIESGQIRYTPNITFYNSLSVGTFATDTFTYTMKDSANVTSTATVTVTINGVNDAPTAVNDAASASEDGPAILISALANDTDPDAGDTKTLVSVDLTGTLGAVSIVGNQIQYDPLQIFDYLAQGATATDTFTYTMKDGQNVTSSATVTVTINGVNDAPIAQNSMETVQEEDPLLMGNVLATDEDNGAVLSYMLLNPAPAGLVFNLDGSFTFDPSDPAYDYLNDGDILDLVIQYVAKDEHLATSNTGVLTIRVTGKTDNLPPVANANNLFVNDVALRPENWTSK